MHKFGFNAAIQWTGKDEAKFESGVGAWADLSKSYLFKKGEGMPGRVLKSGAYEWISNVQNLPLSRFTRFKVSKSTGIKTVLNVAVNGGVVELASK